MPDRFADKNPYNLPTVLDWDDAKIGGDPIMVTLAYGWAFEAGDKDCDGSHVSSFDSVKLAKRAVAKKRLQKCECPRCEEGLMRQDIASALEADDNTPQADGFRSFPEWMDVTLGSKDFAR